MHRFSLGALSAIIAIAFTSIGAPDTAAAPDERRPGQLDDPGSVDRLDERPFLFDGVTDGRVAPKERVVTLGGPDGEAISIPWTELRTTGVANIEHEDVPLVVLWAPGTVSALDPPSIDDSEDVGSTGVFGRVVDEQALTFERTEDTTRFRDARRAARGTSPEEPWMDRWLARTCSPSPTATTSGSPGPPSCQRQPSERPTAASVSTMSRACARDGRQTTDQRPDERPARLHGEPVSAP